MEKTVARGPWITCEPITRPLTLGDPALVDSATFHCTDLRDGADHTSTYIGRIDRDGIVTVADDHTVSEMAKLFLMSPSNPYAAQQRSLTIGMLKTALGVTWNDRTTREFWDAVREQLRDTP